MTRYLLQSDDLPARVLYVRQMCGMWVVGKLPVDPKERHYPNYDYETGRIYWHTELTPCPSKEAMQRKLDDFAKRYGLEKEIGDRI